MPGAGEGLYQVRYHLPQAARTAASPYFVERGVPIEAVARVPFALWMPAECPLCGSSDSLQDP